MKAIIRCASSNSAFSLKIRNQPFPLTKQQKQDSATVQAFLAAAVYSIGLGFIPASIIVLIVKENQFKIKH
jgi:ATP-binding cassette subfamily A (ABC1) protein 3